MHKKAEFNQHLFQIDSINNPLNSSDLNDH